MELSTLDIRIHNYVRNSLRYSLTQAEELYTSKYAPFYKWTIGILNDEEIRANVFEYMSSGNLPKNIKDHTETTNAFSILIVSVEKFTKEKNIKRLDIKDWSEIRKVYETEIKKEWDQTFGTIGFIENIDYRKFQNKAKDDLPEDDYSPVYKSKSIEGLEDYELVQVITEQVLDILEQIFLGNWVVRIETITKQKLLFRIAIFNLVILEENLEQIFAHAIKMLKQLFNSQYGHNEWQIKEIQSKTYIEGLFYSKRQ